jgi:protein phosphatase 2C family protein 2/3
LTRDHKPEEEKKRIIEAGGQIYQTTTQVPDNLKERVGSDVLVGPYRVLPGRLSVSRTFGDPEAKLAKYGGNTNVVIAVPDIISFELTNDHDFLVMGCDGIFDQLSNEDVVKCVWDSVLKEKGENVHQQCAFAVDSIIKNSLLRHSLDNVTSVLIAFHNFKQLTFPNKPTERMGKKMKRNRSAHKESRKLMQDKPKTIALKNTMFPQSVRSNRIGITFGKPKLLKNYIKHH